MSQLPKKEKKKPLARKRKKQPLPVKQKKHSLPPIPPEEPGDNP